MAGKRFTLVPLEFFEDEQTEMLFYHNHPKRENEVIQYNILRKNNTVVLFSMDKSARSFLCEQYPDVRFYSQASSFIEHFSSKSRLGNSRKMYVHLRKMLPNYIATTAITCSLPTLLSANRQQTVSITYYIYGNSLVSNKNATNYILPVSCPTKKLCSVNYENSSGRYSS